VEGCEWCCRSPGRVWINSDGGRLLAMIAFDCACGEPLAAADEHAGRRVRCPKCGTSLAVPEPAYHAKPDATPAPEPLPGPRERPDPVAEGRYQAQQMMTKAHAELAEDAAKRARERRLVVFTPGIIGGLAAFAICTTLAVVSLLLYNLYLAIGLMFFAVVGLFRAILSFVGRGVD